MPVERTKKTSILESQPEMPSVIKKKRSNSTVLTAGHSISSSVCTFSFGSFEWPTLPSSFHPFVPSSLLPSSPPSLSPSLRSPLLLLSLPS